MKLGYIYSKIKAISFLPYSILPLNETCLLVMFENRIDEHINKQVMALHNAFSLHAFKGFTESVPAYSSLAVFYDTAIVKKNCEDCITAFEFVKSFTRQLINDINDVEITNERLKTIPVYYNGEDIINLEKLHRLSAEEIINIHCQVTYRVFMIGFLPGFAYMGKVDERIATLRHASPRTSVPAGSVGIAGFQTGIYPIQSPGGWQLIGQTPLKIFDAKKEPPCLLQAGDTIKFIRISKENFEELNEY